MILDRILATARAEAPLDGGALTARGPVLHFAAAATPAQQAAAWAAVNALDWGEAAVAAWRVAQRRETEAVKFAPGHGTEAALRALVLVLVDEINILRQRAGLTPRTLEQVRTALTTAVRDGTAD